MNRTVSLERGSSHVLSEWRFEVMSQFSRRSDVLVSMMCVYSNVNISQDLNKSQVQLRALGGKTLNAKRSVVSSQKHKAAVCQEHDSTSTALNPQCVYRNAGQCHTGKKKKHTTDLNTLSGSSFTLYTCDLINWKRVTCTTPSHVIIDLQILHTVPMIHTHSPHLFVLQSHFQFGINIHVTMVTEKNPILHCLTFNCSCG